MIIRDHLSETQSETENDCLALALLENTSSVYSHPVVAFSRSKVSMQISVVQYRSRIGFHDHSVNAKDALSRFKDHFWDMMCMALSTANDIILWKPRCNSHAKIETSCYTIHSVECGNTLVDTNCVLQYVCSFTYKVND